MSTLESGTVVDRKYEVLRPLGEGAMAHVYEATHRLTGREVALKVMNAAYLRSPDAARRFLREVRLATELRHPGVVEVIDAGQDPDTDSLYIAMERLRGEDLADRLNKNPPLPDALGWLLEMLPVLAMAHERGVVHRDLKPENTYLARLEDGSESVKLLDFGIARSLGGTTLTQTGMTLGTPIYMSPEQALRPHEVDHRADLWAFGVMLYEVVAGRPPFDDESPHALVLRAAAEQHVALHEAAPGIPMRLSELVDRCLNKNPEDRPNDAKEIERELAAILASGEIPQARPAPSEPPASDSTAHFSLAQEALKRFSETPPRPGTPVPGPAEELGTAATVATHDVEVEVVVPLALEGTDEPNEPRRRGGWWLGGAALFAATGVAVGLWLNQAPAPAETRATPREPVAVQQTAPPTEFNSAPSEGLAVLDAVQPSGGELDVTPPAPADEEPEAEAPADSRPQRAARAARARAAARVEEAPTVDEPGDEVVTSAVVADAVEAVDTVESADSNEPTDSADPTDSGELAVPVEPAAPVEPELAPAAPAAQPAAAAPARSRPAPRAAPRVRPLPRPAPPAEPPPPFSFK